MKFRLITLLLLCSVISAAQTSKFSIEAKYPVPVGQNFVGEDYKGIAGLGIKYHFKALPLVRLGVSVNASLLDFKAEGAYSPEFDEYISFKTRLNMIQPRFFAAFSLKNITKLHPEVGLGYSFLMFKTDFDSGTGIADQSNNEGGININLGVSYDITNRFYARAAYDFIKLTQLADGVDDSGYNTNVGIVELGVGIRL